MNTRFSIKRALLAMTAIAVPLGLLGDMYEGFGKMPALVIGVTLAVAVLLGDFSKDRRAYRLPVGMLVYASVWFLFFFFWSDTFSPSSVISELGIELGIYAVAGLALFARLMPKKTDDE